MFLLIVLLSFSFITVAFYFHVMCEIIQCKTRPFVSQSSEVTVRDV